MPPLITFTRCHNLRDRLVHSDTREPPNTVSSNQTTGFSRCGRCAQCSNSLDTKYFTHPCTGKKYFIKSFINCSSTYVVYMLKCPCGLVHIGQTKRTLKICISEHKTAIHTQNMDYAVARGLTTSLHHLSSGK